MPRRATADADIATLDRVAAGSPVTATAWATRGRASKGVVTDAAKKYWRISWYGVPRCWR